MRGRVSDKIELRVAWAPMHHDLTVWMPLDMTVGEAARLASELCAKREPALWQPGPALLVLCPLRPSARRTILNPNESLRTLRAEGVLASGTRVALM